MVTKPTQSHFLAFTANKGLDIPSLVSHSHLKFSQCFSALRTKFRGFWGFLWMGWQPKGVLMSRKTVTALGSGTFQRCLYRKRYSSLGDCSRFCVCVCMSTCACTRACTHTCSHACGNWNTRKGYSMKESGLGSKTGGMARLRGADLPYRVAFWLGKPLSQGENS